ncbi:MAG: hypothetical protein WKF40_04170 [Thermoleophilaceae bacterium]
MRRLVIALGAVEAVARERAPVGGRRPGALSEPGKHRRRPRY